MEEWVLLAVPPNLVLFLLCASRIAVRAIWAAELRLPHFASVLRSSHQPRKLTLFGLEVFLSAVWVVLAALELFFIKKRHRGSESQAVFTAAI